MNELQFQLQEWQYRYDERLGILAPLREPTVQEDLIATKEADDWLAEYKLRRK